MAARLQVLEVKVGNSDCAPLPYPAHHWLPRGGAVAALPSLRLPLAGDSLPPAHLASLPAGNSWRLLQCWPVCASVTCLVTCLPLSSSAGPSSHCPPGFPATCHTAPPVPLLLSVCPRLAADTAFNSLCPSPFSFLVEGRGHGRHRQETQAGHPLILFLANDT